MSSLEKRKTNITFLSSDSVIITNALWQKTFILKESIVVDLHTLRKIKAENISELSQKAKVDSPFFICFMPDKKDFYGLVVIRPGKDKIKVLQEEEDIISLKNNNKTFSVSVYIKD